MNKTEIIEELIKINLKRTDATNIAGLISESIMDKLSIKKYDKEQFIEKCSDTDYRIGYSSGNWYHRIETLSCLSGSICFGKKLKREYHDTCIRILEDVNVKPRSEYDYPIIAIKHTYVYENRVEAEDSSEGYTDVELIVYLPENYNKINIDLATLQYVYIDELLSNIKENLATQITILKLLSYELCGHDNCIKLSYEFDKLYNENILTYVSIGWGDPEYDKVYGYTEWDFKKNKCKYYSNIIEGKEILVEGVLKSIYRIFPKFETAKEECIKMSKEFIKCIKMAENLNHANKLTEASYYLTVKKMLDDIIIPDTIAIIEYYSTYAKLGSVTDFKTPAENEISMSSIFRYQELIFATSDIKLKFEYHYTILTIAYKLLSKLSEKGVY